MCIYTYIIHTYVYIYINIYIYIYEYTFIITSLSVLLRQTKAAQKTKTHILRSIRVLNVTV